MNQELIPAILAKTDALWLPDRNPTGRSHGALSVQCAEFRTRGVEWSTQLTGADDNATRIRAGRLLDKAIADGLVKSFGESGRRTHVRLTDDGEHRARSLVGLPDLSDVSVIAEIQQAILDGRCATWQSQQWVPETELAGVTYADTSKQDARFKLQDIEDRCLPWMARGCVVSGSTPLGHVWYRLTTQRAHKPFSALGIGIADDAWQTYVDTLKSEQARIQQLDKVTDIGELPLPASMAIGNHFGAGAAR